MPEHDEPIDEPEHDEPLAHEPIDEPVAPVAPPERPGLDPRMRTAIPIVAALVFGLFAGSMLAGGPVPACDRALDHAEQVFGYAADFAGASGEGFEAAARLDVAAMSRISAEMREISGDIVALRSGYGDAATECREATG